MAEKLKELRAEKHLFQKDLAEKTGIAPNTISQYESGIGNLVLRFCLN